MPPMPWPLFLNAAACCSSAVGSLQCGHRRNQPQETPSATEHPVETAA
jgi:hypothetical protein